MSDVLTPEQLADIKEWLGSRSNQWHWSHVARLVATVEQTRRERDAALDALLDIINVALGDPEDVVRLFGRDAAEAHRAVVEQADAIRRARAVPAGDGDAPA